MKVKWLLAASAAVLVMQTPGSAQAFECPKHFAAAQAAIDKLELEGDERTGAAILRRALEEPTRRIAINAGKDGSVTVQEVKRLKKGDGYDALRDDFGNMEKKGIIDPLKVTRAALENAVSIAGLVLTTNCLVADLPEKKEGAAAAPPMPPMY